MRIGEIAEKTGLSISNIRFYEKKGLIGPDRESENQYRNYTDADLERLNLIILYRKMDFPVEVIGKMLSGDIPVEDALEQQLIDLKEKQQMLQSSIGLCQKVIDDRAYETMDVTRYLDYVKEEESNGKIFEKIDDLIEDFSDITRFSYFVGGNNVGWWLFPNAWLNRVVKILWCILFVLIPVIGIADVVMGVSGTPAMTLIFWGSWTLFFAYRFISLRRNNEK